MPVAFQNVVSTPPLDILEQDLDHPGQRLDHLAAILGHLGIILDHPGTTWSQRGRAQLASRI
eukprot:7611727-Karenia_brevis.AAC.1